MQPGAAGASEGKKRCLRHLQQGWRERQVFKQTPCPNTSPEVQDPVKLLRGSSAPRIQPGERTVSRQIQQRLMAKPLTALFSFINCAFIGRLFVSCHQNLTKCFPLESAERGRLEANSLEVWVPICLGYQLLI